MKREIVIEPFEEFGAVNYYVIRFKDEEDSEFDKFFSKFDGDETFGESFNVIIEWLNKIGEEGGVDEHLRREGGNLKAIPIVASKLRLYCFRINECIIILGNGGHKPKHIRAYQDDPELNKYVSDLREAGRHLINRINNSERASIYQCKLYGDLEFNIETT
ncbi:MAG TPA: hypothetical protein VHO46_03635 [Bacteroidales bacterium]|nr:hypothetical protein [Bacteroidales bacterium]